MGEDGSADPFKRFALGLYGSNGVANACLYLQNRHDLDVNVVLFAGFVGAVRRQTLTTPDVDAARRRVDAWHREVVRPLRGVRQRLKTGPAPNDVTARLRRQVSASRDRHRADRAGSTRRADSCVGAHARIWKRY
jgi:uncharacterized protein (TIGR02444 family)